MDTKYILSISDYFKDNTLHHLYGSNRAYQSRELLSTVVSAAVFTESLLKDILIELLGNRDVLNHELSKLIDTLRRVINNRGNQNLEHYNPETDATQYINLLNHADEIRQKRNRIVHDVGMKNTGLESDVSDVMSNLKRIANCYIQTTLAAEIRIQKLSKPADLSEDSAEEAVAPDFRVFLSTITPHTFDQEVFIDSFCKKLRKLGIEPVRGNPTSYYERMRPMESARGHMKTCDAVIILGLERTHAYFIRDREDSDRMTEAMHRRYTSSWLHLEAGIAIGLEKDVFVMCQEDLFPDGIFDADENSYPRVKLRMPLSTEDPALNGMLRDLLSLKEQRKNQNHASD